MAVQEGIDYVSELISKYVPDEIHNYIPESMISRTLLVGTTTGILAYLIFKKRYKLPPGPWSLPIIGHRMFASDENIARKWFDLSKIYGPVLTVYMGPSPVVVLNNIESVNEALLKKGAQFAGRFAFYSADQLFHNSEDIIFSRYSTGWKLRRKIASRAIRLFMVNGNFNQKIEDAVKKTVDTMLKEKGAFDPKPYLFYTTLNIIAAMCFGKCYGYEDKEYRDLLRDLDRFGEVNGDGFVFENIFPWFAGLYKTRRYRQLEVITNGFIAFIEQKVNVHKEKFVPGQIHDFTDSLLQAAIEIEAEGEDNMTNFEPIHIVLTVLDIFFAGNDTSRQTLLYSLMYTIGVPGIQQKLQQEVDSVIGKDRYPTTDDRDNLPYSSAVLQEAMRMGPVVPAGVPHTTTCDTTLGEYEIPKDTMVIINHYAMHNDPNKWEEVDRFKPERYLDEDGKLAPKPESWLPFSAGRRVCLGEPLAKPELQLIIASLFQRLEFSPEPGTQIDMELVEKNVTITPKPFKVVVKKR
ncbi:hypothetical protein LOTGIDRAFT_204704 [Lottia gigantea]|uniref:Uncharacterized protein n=1 Tax=Lottia gigantea TaxID=225164 RepID=V3ZK67_LOTGI|nr:hypothetical protein LOTGIDRAFT_204704 [Lottia gigantea]ESO84647.1 hypothetical protein LOTGIDRAFT_204704 [Lottia gigantea]